MKMKAIQAAILAVLILMCVPLMADQLIMKDGKEYTGKLVRADGTVVEFRIGGRVETFKMADVAQIVIKEPEMVNPPIGRTLSNDPPAPSVRQVPPEPAPLDPDTRPPAANPRSSGSIPPAGRATVTLPQGTSLTIRMEESVDTDRNRVGDTFQATLEEQVLIGNQVIIPRGAAVKGSIAYSRESGRATGQSELILELTEIRVNGRSYTLQTSDYNEVGVSRGKRTAAAATGVAALGAIIGAVAGGGKGAVVGATTGAAVGATAAVMTRGQTLKVPAETILDFKLQKPLTVDAP
jgi:hypothetical protein